MTTRWAPWTALLLIVAAGCTAQAPPASPEVAQPTSVPPLPTDLKVPAILPEVQLGRADIGSEPNIAVAPNGTVYVTTPLQLWRSTDGGLTYTALGEPACPVFQQELPSCVPALASQNPGLDGGGDGDIAVDSQGRIHWVGLVGKAGPIPYQVSSDAGASFSAPIDLSAGKGFDRQWIDATPDGHLFAAWRDNDGYVVNRSLDLGASWLGKVVVGKDMVGGPIIHDPSHAGRWFIPGLGGTGVQMWVSDDDGLNWTSREAMPVPAGPSDFFATSIFPVAAVDDAGTLYLVASHKTATTPGAVPKQASQYAVYLTVSHDHGRTWSKELQVSPALKVAIMPWVAAGAPGRIAIAYYQNTVGLPNDNLPDLWNVILLESITADKDTPAFVAAQLNQQPNHIGSVCTSGSLCTAIGGDRSLLDFFELAIGPDGQPKVTWSGDSDTPPVLSSMVFAGGASSGTRLR